MRRDEFFEMSELLPLWKKCLNELKYQVKDNVFTMWLRPLVAEFNGDVLEIKAPNEYFVKEINKDYLPLILQAVKKHSDGKVTEVVVCVAQRAPVAHSSLENNSNVYPEYKENKTPITSSESVLEKSKELPVELSSSNDLNPSFTFDTFVTGKSNSFAYKACYELSKRKNENQHNPLFIYGGSGLGKTHLMHALAHRYVKSNRTFYYFTSDKFVNQMVYALRMSKIEEFKQRIQKVDLLIIDDIHVLAGKTKTTAEFLTLFSDFTNGDKQLILASDRHPAQLTEFDSRFRSRLYGGLSVAVEPPELETRVQILYKKAEGLNIVLPKECALFIAQHVVSNVRSLEGALNQVLAHANLTGSPISLEMVKYALKDIVAMRVQAVSIDNIRKVVAEYFNVSVKDLMSKKRTRTIARPRQIAMALSRELTKESFPDIGQYFGGRDHTTVMHACTKVDELRLTDPKFDKDYKSLSVMLQAG